MWPIAAVCVGSLLTLLQAASLFILSDLRSRIMRLETNAMDEADRELDRVRRRNRLAASAGD